MYIIIFNFGQRDFYVMQNSHGFVETYNSHEDAVIDAENNLSSELRNYEIFEKPIKYIS